MTEKTKNTLIQIRESLQITSIVAGGIIAIVVLLFWIDDRIDTVEAAQSKFEGIIEERTRNTAKRVDDIYDIVKDWSPEYAKTTKK